MEESGTRGSAIAGRRWLGRAAHALAEQALLRIGAGRVVLLVGEEQR